MLRHVWNECTRLYVLHVPQVAPARRADGMQVKKRLLIPDNYDKLVATLQIKVQALLLGCSSAKHDAEIDTANGRCKEETPWANC